MTRKQGCAMRSLVIFCHLSYLFAANRDILVTEDGSFTQRYVYDETGARVSGEFRYADGTARGSTNANGEYGENLQSDFAAQEIQKVYYRTNILGSGLFAVDRDGDVISHTVYDPWGEPQTDTYPDANYSGLDNTNNFTGYTWDEVLKLYFAQNRFYDPANHRFTQEDIVKDGQNWYVYCGNEPVTHVDWLGYWAAGDSNYSYEAQLQLLTLTYAYYDARTELVRRDIQEQARKIRELNQRTINTARDKLPIAADLDRLLKYGYMEKAGLCVALAKNRIELSGQPELLMSYVMHITLSNPDFVSVLDENGRLWKGGDQNWLSEESQKSTGCGSISITNVLYYYMLKNSTGTTTVVDKEDYLDMYYQYFGANFFEFWDGRATSLVTSASQYEFLANRAFQDQGLNVTANAVQADLTGVMSKKKMRDLVIYSLMTDNPVALQNYVNSNKKITNWHWVTIMDADIRPFDMDLTKVGVSTWGTEVPYKLSDVWEVDMFLKQAAIVYFTEGRP